MRKIFGFMFVLSFMACICVQAAEQGEAPVHKIKKRAKNAGFRVLSEAEAKKLTTIRSRPWNCPICGKKVDIPLEQISSGEYDQDLCPHPIGKVKFFTSTPICGHCGFAAYRQDFMKPQTEEIKSWVRRELTPRTRRTLREIIALKVKIPEEELHTYFKQSDLPDTVRCNNALQYYQKIRAKPARLARASWEMAWAIRRSISGPIRGLHVMEGIRKIMEALAKEATGKQDVEWYINSLAAMYEQKEKFSYMELQIIRLMLAGYYDRLGLTSWARTCLNQVKKNARKRYSGTDNPWLQGCTGSAKEQEDTAELKRQVIEHAAEARLLFLDKEMKYTEQAANYLREAIAGGEYSPEAVASYVFLVGEFERRVEHFTLARLWFGAADKLAAKGKFRIEHQAQQQVGLMRDYMEQRGILEFPQNGAKVRRDQNLLSKYLGR